jgi:hypothetical protein
MDDQYKESGDEFCGANPQRINKVQTEKRKKLE